MQPRSTFRSHRQDHWFPAMIAAWMSLFALGLVDSGRGAVFPDLTREFGLSNTTASYFYLTSSLFGAGHNILMHRFLSRKQPGHLIAIYSLIMSLGAVVIALGTIWSVSLVGAAIIGVGFGGIGVAQNAAVQAAPSSIRSRAFGALHSMYGISSLLAPLALSAALVLGLGWRNGYLALAILSLGASVLFLRRWESLAGRREASPPEAPPGPVGGAINRVRGSLPFLCAILVGLIVVAEVSVSTRLSLLARTVWGLSPAAASLSLSAFFAAVTVSRLAIGLLQLPGTPSQALRVLLGMALPILLIALWGDGKFHWVQWAALVAYAVPVAGLYPLVMVRIQEIFGAQSQSVTSMSITTQSLFGMGMHFSLGWLADSVGILPALRIVTIAAVIGAGTVFLVIERLTFGHHRH